MPGRLLVYFARAITSFFSFGKKVKPGVLCAGRQLLSIAAEVYLPYRDLVQRRRGNLRSDAKA